MAIDTSILVPSLIAAGIILLVSFPVHEAAHAFAAYRLGDGTAKLFGRLTLNPIAHFDPVGGLILVASSIYGIGIGWAKPTPVNPSNLRGGHDSEGIVAFAGPASNLVLAALGGILFRLAFAVDAAPEVLLQVLYIFVRINVALAIFNLVPIPPLDGSKVLFSMMNPRQVWRWRPVLEQYGFIILLAVAFIPLLPNGNTIFGFIFLKIGIPLVSFFIGQPLG